jgi:hypothetical protein
MSTRPITPRLADRFCLLAVSQLQTQMSRSGTLDTGALGVVSACAAIAAIVLGVRSAHHLWIAALVLLVLSLGLALYALHLPGAEQIGPLVTDMLDARVSDDDAYLEGILLEDLAAETVANEQTIERKDPLLARAVTLLVLAIVLEPAGVRMSAMEPPTANRPTRDYPRTPDGKYKYTTSDGSPRYFQQVKMPGVASQRLRGSRRSASATGASR